MPNPFYRDILDQAGALRALASFYTGAGALSTLPVPVAPVITGMGASYHAAIVAAAHMRSLGIPATAIEAIDLLRHGDALLRSGGPLVFISQSGASAEVAPLVERLPPRVALLAITNDPASPLARAAHTTLELHAGAETTVATRTYLNSLALLWLLARHWSGRWDDGAIDALRAAAGACERLVAQAGPIAAHWLDALASLETLVFLGHGPHVATARQAAMMLAEWAKAPALALGIGAFRHGFIEVTQPGVGVVIFAPAGPSQASALALAGELHGYGARVLVVQNGETRDASQATTQDQALDEFLAPMLDVVPAQLFAEALARHRGIPPGFRYISKVVTRL